LQILTSVTSPHCSKCCRSLSSLRCLGSPLTQSRDEPLIALVPAACCCWFCCCCFPSFHLLLSRRATRIWSLAGSIQEKGDALAPCLRPLPRGFRLAPYFTCPRSERQTGGFLVWTKFSSPVFQRRASQFELRDLVRSEGHGGMRWASLACMPDALGGWRKK
jgi:hypothetical protein